MYELEDWAFAISGLVIGQNPPYLAGLSLVQIDTNGVLLGYRTYFDVTEDDYSFYQSIGFTKLKQNAGFAMLGVLFSRRNGVLMVTDAEGEPIFVKEYP